MLLWALIQCSLGVTLDSALSFEHHIDNEDRTELRMPNQKYKVYQTEYIIVIQGWI